MFSIKKLQNKFTPKKQYLQPSTKLKNIFSTPHSQKLQSKTQRNQKSPSSYPHQPSGYSYS